MEKLVLNRLLDKYENSSHLSSPGTSNKRVMLNVESKGFPEYDYENAEIRDSINGACIKLEKEGVIFAEWLVDRPLLKKVILNLSEIELAYKIAGRLHPFEQIKVIKQLLDKFLLNPQKEWVASWKKDILISLDEKLKIPPICKDKNHFENLLLAISNYDMLENPCITVRTFSSMCFNNSKIFENEYEADFIKIASKYCSDLLMSLDAENSEIEPIGNREKLAALGIYAHPEQYFLSGNFKIRTNSGSIDFSAANNLGLSLPSTLVDSIEDFVLDNIKVITFIENKTNYEEYTFSEQAKDELVIYQGGFQSPQKRFFLQKLSESLTVDIKIRFWADIDLGGFRMFDQLKSIFENLAPMRMDKDCVIRYKDYGLKRKEAYLKILENALLNDEFPLFNDAIKEILKYGVTIEQEVFLD